MNDRPALPFGPVDLLEALRKHARLWIVPTVVFSVAALLFVCVRPNTWEASQALIVRHEAIGTERADGRFDDLSQMKAVQETILEVIKSKSVLQAALEATGRPASSRGLADWPSARDIVDLREDVVLAPPKGAEFGSTEVFYVKVRNHDRRRALSLVQHVCEQLNTRLQQLRDEKARSLMNELQRAETLAQGELDQATRQLTCFEREVGADLAELRILQSSPSGSSSIRQNLVPMENELRRYETEKQRNEQLLAILSAARRDPNQLVATPNSLLASQPALRRLKDGLVDAQLRTAQLAGAMTGEHPLVRASVHAEQETRDDLHAELTLAIQGVQTEWKLNSRRAADLEQQLAGNHARLAHVAGMRAEYANLVASAENRAVLLEGARRDLAEANANQAAAHTTSLIGRIDGPEGGLSPIGPGKATLVASAVAGGLLVGWGLVFLVASPTEQPVAPAPRTPAPRTPAVSPAGARRRTRFETPRGRSFGRALRTLACTM
ncbi:MAG: Wzz/FepE/Etk N-terminal domain-containing protein [Pirellulales bacterium]